MHKCKQWRAEWPRHKIMDYEDDFLLFLDIDGVIQPYGSDYRFDHDLDTTREELAKQFDTPILNEMDCYDIGAAYYDWSPIALGYLTEFIEETRAKVVIHSSWRKYNSLEKLKALFKLYHMDHYIVDVVGVGDKSEAIKQYLQDHPTNRYIVIDDDSELIYHFGFRQIITNNRLSEDDYKRMQIIFRNQYKLVELENKIEYYVNDKPRFTLKYENTTLDDGKIVRHTYVSAWLNHYGEYHREAFVKDLAVLSYKYKDEFAAFIIDSPDYEVKQVSYLNDNQTIISYEGLFKMRCSWF